MDNNVCNFNTEPLKLDIEIVRRGEREKIKHSDSTAGKAWKCAGIHTQPEYNTYKHTHTQLSILNFTLGKDAEFSNFLNSLIHSLGCMMPCLLSWS